MALGAGSIVTMKVASGDLPGTTVGPDITPQPPRYGKVIQAALDGGPADVLWQDGILDLTLPIAGIDDLYSVAPATRAALWGQIVVVSGESAEYQYVVISMFRRGAVGAVEKAVLRPLNRAGWREVRTSALVAVTGR